MNSLQTFQFASFSPSNFNFCSLPFPHVSSSRLSTVQQTASKQFDEEKKRENVINEKTINKLWGARFYRRQQIGVFCFRFVSDVNDNFFDLRLDPLTPLTSEAFIESCSYTH